MLMVPVPDSSCRAMIVVADAGQSSSDSDASDTKQSSGVVAMSVSVQ